MMNLEETARAAFDAYNEHGPNPWKTFDGRDVPRWEQLNDDVRAKWTAAVRATIVVFLRTPAESAAAVVLEKLPEP